MFQPVFPDALFASVQAPVSNALRPSWRCVLELVNRACTEAVFSPLTALQSPAQPQRKRPSRRCCRVQHRRSKTGSWLLVSCPNPGAKDCNKVALSTAELSLS